MIAQKLRILGLSTVMALGVAACASTDTKEATSASETMQTQTKMSVKVPALYEVHHDGRIYFF
jgi:outer membrane lipoprotein SlyB